MKRISTVLILTAAMALSSCSSTKLVSTWRSNDVSVGTFNKILVVGLMGNRERELREKIENNMVIQLREKGYNASTGTEVFGPRGFKGMKEEDVSAKLKDSGYSAVFIVSLLDKEKERVYTPGTAYTYPVVIGYSRFYRRYAVLYDNVYSPGYYSNRTNYILQIEGYSIPQNEMIYTAQTKSLDPNNIETLSKEFSKTVVTDMEQKGLR